MKKTIPACLLMLSVFCSTLSAQTRQDVIDCLEAVLSLPEIHPVYQIDCRGGETAVIRQSDEFYVHGNDLHRIFNRLRETDLGYLPGPVLFRTETEIQQENLPLLHCLSVGMQFRPGEMTIHMNTYLDDDRRKYFRGLFRLEKIAGAWELVNHKTWLE